MLRVVLLRRCDASAISVAKIEAAVTRVSGSVIDRSDRTFLVDVARPDGMEALGNKPHGWIASEQRSKIPVPDTRLKVRSRERSRSRARATRHRRLVAERYATLNGTTGPPADAAAIPAPPSAYSSANLTAVMRLVQTL